MSGEPGLNPAGVYVNMEYSGGSVVRAPCCKLSPVVRLFDKTSLATYTPSGVHACNPCKGMTAHWKEAAEYDVQQLLRCSAFVHPARKCALSGGS